MNWRRWILLGASFLAIVVLAGMTKRGLSQDQGTPANTAADMPLLASVALTVSTVRAQPMRWQREITTSGSIAAWQQAVVSAEVGGIKLADVLVDVGDQVRRGQLLARFDDASLRTDLAQQQALVSEAEANLEEARSTAARAIQLRASRNISDQDLSSARHRARAAEALLQSAQARLDSQALSLQHTRVLAPDDGVILSRSAMLGAVPSVGTELFRLVRQNRLQWLAELTAAQIPRISQSLSQGMVATVTLPDGSTVAGRVRQLAPTLDDNTRTGVAFVDLEPSGARPGMYAAGTIMLGAASGLAVPSSALVIRDGREYVFVVSADQHVALEPVQTGRRSGTEVEITAGITASQDLVASGGTFLNDGDRVRIAAPDHSS